MFDTMNYLNYHNAFNSKNDDDGYDWDDDDMEYMYCAYCAVCRWWHENRCCNKHSNYFRSKVKSNFKCEDFED